MTPLTVHLTGDGIKEIGVEQEVQARLYQVTGALLQRQDRRHRIHPRAPGQAAPDEDTGQPKTTEILAKIYDRMYWVLGLTFGILALGGTLLFRKGAA